MIYYQCSDLLFVCILYFIGNISIIILHCEDGKMAATIARIIVLAFCLVSCQLRVFAFEDDAGMKRFEFGPSTENLDTTERIYAQN